jgi:hypothetical protein
VPAIPPEILDTVVYLYPDTDCAARGEKAGGSGCIVVVEVQAEPLVGFMYVVTNSHVIREGKCSTIRLNTRDGGMAVIERTTGGWIHHPFGDDVAVLPIHLEYESIKARGITLDWFITKEKMEAYKISPGDEAFFVGRFVNHEGKQRNLPAVRFGNMSMLPYEPIRTGRGILQEAFIVEAKSLPGYSGSPVFLNPLPSPVRGGMVPPPMFLGIDLGHIKDETTVLDKEALRQGRRVPIDNNWTVETNTGMACVIPAWKIREVLDDEELVKNREEALKIFEQEKNTSPVSSDAAELDDAQNRSFTQSDFEDALRKATRRLE